MESPDFPRELIAVAPAGEKAETVALPEIVNVRLVATEMELVVKVPSSPDPTPVTVIETPD